MKGETMVRTCLTASVMVFMVAIPALGVDSAKVGKPAPDFVATGIDGNPVKLSARVATGKKNIVLVFSRASW